MSKIRVAIYSRKSVLTEQGESIDNQIELCKNYINTHMSKVNGEVKYSTFIDEGFSGGNIDRPEFQKMLKDIEAKKFDVLICYRLDRISRNVADFSSVLEKLTKYNVEFISIKEQFDTSSPMGRAMVYISSVFAQLERETIAERVKDNMLELAKTGRWLGGTSPLGLESYRTKDGDKKVSYLKWVDNEVETVKVMFDVYLKHRSIASIETYMLKNNITQKQGGKPNRANIKDIITNPIYAKCSPEVVEFYRDQGATFVNTEDNKGVMSYNKHTFNKGIKSKNEVNKWVLSTGKHEGIIEAKDFIQVQRLLVANGNKNKAARSGTSHTALLSGLIRCSLCSSPIIPHFSKLDKYGNRCYSYVCSLKKHSRGTKCDNPTINHKILEPLVVDYMLNFDINTLLSEVNNIKDNKDLSKVNNLRNKLEKELKDIESKINNLLQTLSASAGTAAYSYIIAEIDKLDKSKKEIEKQLDNLQDQEEHKEDTITQKLKVIEDITNFKTAFNLCQGIDDKKRLLQAYVDKIYWNGHSKDLVIDIIGYK